MNKFYGTANIQGCIYFVYFISLQTENIYNYFGNVTLSFHCLKVGGNSVH